MFTVDMINLCRNSKKDYQLPPPLPELIGYYSKAAGCKVNVYKSVTLLDTVAGKNKKKLILNTRYHLY